MPTRYWLMKSDPETFGWNHLLASPGRKTIWDGVRNYQARNFLRDDVKRGDGVLFYHSGDERAVVGTCTVSRGGFPDPKDASWAAVEIAARDAFTSPVTLADLRAIPELATMALLQKGNRLSIQPVTEAEWKAVTALGAGRGRRKKG
jgi:predicted RNA-binding protein with PUA-like domain